MLGFARGGLASLALLAGIVHLGHAVTLPTRDTESGGFLGIKPGLNIKDEINKEIQRIESQDWKDIKCDDKGVTNATDHESYRWFHVQADQAWQEISEAWKNWKSQNPDRDFNFSRYVSDYVHGPEGMDCQSLIDANGCHSGSQLQCHDVNHPAGYFILNSMRNLQGGLWNLHETLEKARNDIDGILGSFSEAFAPQKEKGMDVDIIMDIVLLGYGSFAAPMWSKMMKRWNFQGKDRDGFENLEDFSNALASNGISAAKDITQSSDTELSTQNNVKERLTEIVRVWEKSLVKLAEKMFSGNDEDVEMLGRIFKNGKMMESRTSIPSVETLRNMLAKSIFASLIPLAWDISDRKISAFILNTGVSCEAADGDWGQNEDKFLDNVKGATKICKDGRAYFLVAASGDCSASGSAFQDNDNKDCGKFPLLPGAEKLDGKAWGGITREDIVVGSLNTYSKNGNKNQEDRSQRDSIPADTLAGLADSIQAAGTFALPICSLKVAWDNFYNNDKADRNKNHFPCNIDHNLDWKKEQDKPPPYDCNRSGKCDSTVNFVRDCDIAVNKGLERNDEVTYGSAASGKNKDGEQKGSCKIFIAGPAECTRTGNQMWDDYQEIKSPEKGKCSTCGSKHWGDWNKCRTTVNYVFAP